jgi:uncharacterized repeat protein (TIGR01451 family)
MNLNKLFIHQVIGASSAIALLLSAPSFAQTAASNAQKSGVAVTHVAEVETTITSADGKKELRRAPAAKVEPGKVVVYTTRLQNQGKEPATQLSLVAPVPPNTTLLESASFGEAPPLYSIDQGKNFAPLAQLVVDKEGRQRPARSTDITHLRWQPQKPLPPGAVVEMGFKVQVN